MDYLVQPVPALEIATILLPGGIPIELCRIPAGTFWMGSREPQLQEGLDPDAAMPRHRVQITQDYWLSKCPIRWAEFQAFMLAESEGIENWPIRTGSGTAPNQPVVDVSWVDAVAFCDWLNAARSIQNPRQRVIWPEVLADFAATLPTEAQWERACRGVAGEGEVEQDYGCGNGCLALEDFAWFGLNFNKINPGLISMMIPSVGLKLPTDWGLHDIHGLVWEWVQHIFQPDTYKHRGETVIDPVVASDVSANQNKSWQDAKRVLRGGSWVFPGAYCGCAVREKVGEGDWIGLRGFRLAVVLGPNCIQT